MRDRQLEISSQSGLTLHNVRPSVSAGVLLCSDGPERWIVGGVYKRGMEHLTSKLINILFL